MAAPTPLELTMFPALWQSFVDYVNGILKTFVPGGEVYEVAIIAFIISYSIKTKNRWGNMALVISGVVIFFAMRHLGFGGP